MKEMGKQRSMELTDQYQQEAAKMRDINEKSTAIKKINTEKQFLKTLPKFLTNEHHKKNQLNPEKHSFRDSNAGILSPLAKNINQFDKRSNLQLQSSPLFGSIDLQKTYKLSRGPFEKQSQFKRETLQIQLTRTIQLCLQRQEIKNLRDTIKITNSPNQVEQREYLKDIRLELLKSLGKEVKNIYSDDQQNQQDCSLKLNQQHFTMFSYQKIEELRSLQQQDRRQYYEDLKLQQNQSQIIQI